MKRHVTQGSEQRNFCSCGLLAQRGGMWKHSGSPTWRLSKNLPFWVFMEVSLHRHDWLTQWLWVIDSTSSPSPISRNKEVVQKVSTLSSWLVPLATSPHQLGAFQKLPSININPVMVKWVSCYSKPTLSTITGPEVLAGTEDKGSNSITKDASISLITQEVPRELWARNCGENQIHIRNTI